MNKSVVFYGWYGPGNVGDELLLSSLLKWAQQNALDPVVVSYDVAYTKCIHGVKAVDVEDLAAIANAVAESEACILGGGGIFQTHNEFSYGGLFNFGCTDVSAYARPVILARRLGVPSVLIGQGVGPLIHDHAREIVREVFNLAEIVSVRDKASLDLLKFIGVERDIPLAPDLVWALPIEKINYTEYNERRKRIALVIRPWFMAKGFEDNLILAIKAVMDPRHYTLVWIPFQNNSIPNRSASDKSFIQQCMGKLELEWHQELIEVDRPERVIDAMSGCDAVVAMRLHAQILAFKLGKPALSVEYDKKMGELSIQVQLDAALRIQPDDDPRVWERALERLCDLDKPAGFNFEIVEKLQLDAAQHFCLLDKLIETSHDIDQTRRQIRLQDINWLEYWLIWIEKQNQVRTNQCMAERDAQIANLNQAVVERDVQIAGLNQAVTERDGQIASLNQAVTERDGQIANLNQTVSENNFKALALNDDILKIKKSNSWRLTSPLRVAANLLISPRKTTYSAIRKLFWKLPASVRQALHGPRHAFVRSVRGVPVQQFERDPNPSHSDLSWTEFNEKVLSKRDDYKGVFIQEVIIDWNVPLYQRPQHISAALGRLGYLVIYRTDNWTADDVNGFREVSKNVWLTNRYEVEEIQGCVRSLYSTAYANTTESLLKNGKRGRIVYEYIDHIDPEISGDQENIRRLLSLKNFAFGGGADFIVASARKLYEEAVEAVGKEKVILVPNGVDTIHYRSSLHITTLIPESLVLFKEKHKAIVGYFGALAPWLWYDVIAELASQRPDLGFVFIGPDYYGGSEKLPKFENVLYLGTIDYKILPAYARQFDVCFIPFKPGEIAKTTSPLKLFEYFALEKPVVVTSDMDECTAYTEVFRGGSVDELTVAIDAALNVKDPDDFKIRLRSLADKNDWLERAKSMEFCFGKIENE